MKLYLSGPMSGVPQFNIPAFDAAAKSLRDRGHEVISPAEMDDEDGITGYVLDSKNGNVNDLMKKTGMTYGQVLARDVQVILDTADLDGVFVMDRWVKSKGAKLEVFCAMLRGLKVFEEDQKGYLLEISYNRLLVQMGLHFLRGER